ncbi:MAG: hypothetical protein WEF86_03095, partial [Gemmatimonadota bacterium]
MSRLVIGAVLAVGAMAATAADVRSQDPDYSDRLERRMTRHTRTWAGAGLGLVLGAGATHLVLPLDDSIRVRRVRAQHV